MTHQTLCSLALIGGLTLAAQPALCAELSQPESAPSAQEAVITDPILKAIDSKDVAALRKAIASGADVNAQPGGFSYAVVCIYRGFPEGIAPLKEAGLDLNRFESSTGLPPLCFAISADKEPTQLESVRALLDCGADPNIETEFDDLDVRGSTPLNYAVIFGIVNAGKNTGKNYLAITRLLLERGANPDSTPRHSSETPLLTAILNNNLPFVELLLEFGADLTASTGEKGLHIRDTLNLDKVSPAVKQRVAKAFEEAEAGTFALFGVTLAQPVDRNRIPRDAWKGYGGYFKLETPFRKFDSVHLTLTPKLKYVKAIEATCNVGDFSTREAEVVREALSKKFGLQFKKLSEREARRINLLKTYNSDDGGSWNYPGSFSINPYAFHYSDTTIWSAKKAGCRIIVADNPRFGRVGIAAFYENPERLQRLEEDAKEAEWENIGTDLDAL